ncbi:hypothetical protein Cal6303_0147 [Calothrix sp. PCC 6303]|nr:hypothetical protein Cal6303_0147 [Calothrix sp. PCC 6303]
MNYTCYIWAAVLMRSVNLLSESVDSQLVEEVGYLRTAQIWRGRSLELEETFTILVTDNYIFLGHNLYCCHCF